MTMFKLIDNKLTFELQILNLIQAKTRWRLSDSRNKTKKDEINKKIDRVLGSSEAWVISIRKFPI